MDVRLTVCAAAGLSVCALLLSGCGPASGGVLGLRREVDGTLSAVVKMCTGGVDGVIAYVPDTDIDLSWEFAERVTEEGSLPLGVQFEDDLDAEETYLAYGWSSDSAVKADGVDFTQAQLAGLAVGDIWSFGWLDDAAAHAYSTDDFHAMVERYCAQLP